MKLKKRCALLVMLLLTILYPIGAAFAQGASSAPQGQKPSEDEWYENYEYVLDAYDIHVKVNENNTLDITETITAYFNVEKHGIYRKIPTKNTVTRLDGSTTKNRALISNVKVNDHFTKSLGDGMCTIKIGREESTYTGEKTYEIRYNYNLGKDPLNDCDEFYFNLIGDEWDTAIGNITFTIEMPKDFDPASLGFSSGDKGSTENENVHYSVEGNLIRGYYDGILGTNQALTVRLTLPEGYFVGAGFPVKTFDYVLFALPVVFAVIAVVLWSKYGKDDLVVPTVEFYPPEGMDSLEMGFWYKGRVQSKEVISLLVYLANQGYLQISEEGGETPGTKKKWYQPKSSFVITKLKDYGGGNHAHQLFLTGLFKGGRTTVRKKDLENSFYKTVSQITIYQNKKENRRMVFDQSASKMRVWAALMAIVGYAAMNIPPMFTFGDPAMYPVVFIFSGMGIGAMLFLFWSKEVGLVGKILGAIWGLLFAATAWIAMLIPALLMEKSYLICYIIGFVFTIITAIATFAMGKRTQKGTEMLGKILGFKDFLETAEKNRLEALVAENPTYFYDILPYTYVLDVSDVWMEKFATIAMEPPHWYAGTGAFYMDSFSGFMDSTMRSASSAMTSSPGGGSGGGSSGGGSGGGGGGSW